MRTLKRLLLLLGVLLLVVLVYRVGSEPILETLRRLAWWQFVLICVPYGLMMAVDTLGWRYAFLRDSGPFGRLYAARMVGEALNIVTALGCGIGADHPDRWEAAAWVLALSLGRRHRGLLAGASPTVPTPGDSRQARRPG